MASPASPVRARVVTRKRWPAAVAVALMLLAMFGYLASLDESEPDALPDAIQGSPAYGE